MAALLAEAFPVPVDNLPAGHVSLALIFILGTALIYGWPAAIIVAFLTRVVLELLQQRPLVRLLYNGALYALAAAAAGIATSVFAPHEPVSMLAVEVVAAATAFYLVNIPLVAAIMARWSSAYGGERPRSRTPSGSCTTLGADDTEHGGTVSCSAGVATFPQHGRDRAELVRVADISLYWAKAEGRNRVRVYEPDRPVAQHLQQLATGFDRGARLGAASALAGAVDARDAYTGGHSERVGELAAACAARFPLPPEQIELVRLAGRLHDLGKVAIPEEILRKPGPLTDPERLSDRAASADRVQHLDASASADGELICAHERWDGQGYPANLSGEQIPIGADHPRRHAYDAMIDRSTGRA